MQPMERIEYLESQVMQLMERIEALEKAFNANSPIPSTSEPIDNFVKP